MSDFKESYEAGLAANPKPFGVAPGATLVLVPGNFKVEDLSAHLPAPPRIRQTVNLNDAGSFARYVQEFQQPASRLFALPHESGGTFRCVLDYHEKDAPRWGSHCAVYVTPWSEEWKLWSGHSRHWKPQREFAEFIESNAVQIINPPSAQFLDVAQTLMTKTTVAFTGTTRLDSGRDQIDYQATSEAKAGEKGNLMVPALFELGLPVFLAGTTYKVKARLRHRITDAKRLELCYELVNPQLIIRAAWDETVDMVRKATKLEVFNGMP